MVTLKNMPLYFRASSLEVAISIAATIRTQRNSGKQTTLEKVVDLVEDHVDPPVVDAETGGLIKCSPHHLQYPLISSLREFMDKHVNRPLKISGYEVTLLPDDIGVKVGCTQVTWKEIDKVLAMRDPKLKAQKENAQRIAGGMFPPHNPAGLTDEQIGTAEGWRLLDVDEVGPKRGDTPWIEMWSNLEQRWISNAFTGSILSNNYRTKLDRAALAALPKW